MLVNQKQKINKKSVYIFIAFILLVTTIPISALAASASASLDGSSTSAKTKNVTASKAGNYSIEAANTGANTTVRGYGKRVVSILPDATEASTAWLNPGGSGKASFSVKAKKSYYGQVYGQTKSSRGNVKLTY